MDELVHLKITGLEYNRILFDAGMSQNRMKIESTKYVMQRYGVAEEDIRTVVVDPVDPVILVVYSESKR